MTLKQLSNKIGVHPYDLVGDEELAEELMNSDIESTIFYQELKHEAELRGIL
jgi:hypothetical protein